MQIRREPKPTGILNITPLIDVVFILLVFFMLATNFASYRLIRVDTPRETEVIDTTEGAITIALSVDGSISFDNRPVDRSDLLLEIQAVVAIDPGRTFLVRPGRGVPLQEAIDIYDVAREAGARAVSFSSAEDEATP